MTATTAAPFAPGQRVTRNLDGAIGTVETVTPWDATNGDFAVAVRLDQDGEVWSGTEIAWTLVRKPTAAEKRYAALNALCTSVRNFDQDLRVTVWAKTSADRAEVAASIRELAPLGRTERWTVNVEAWAHHVETEGLDAPAETVESLFQWAFEQYGVWTSYAAE